MSLPSERSLSSGPPLAILGMLFILSCISAFSLPGGAASSLLASEVERLDRVLEHVVRHVRVEEVELRIADEDALMLRIEVATSSILTLRSLVSKNSSHLAMRSSSVYSLARSFILP